MTDAPPRLLISDDNALLRMVLRDVLVERGFDVVAEAAGGEDILKELERVSVDLVITDILKPGMMDGIQATREITRRYPDLPVLILSAYDDPRMVDAALDAGARTYLKKGSSREQLVDAIRSLAGTHADEPATG